jgi:hypothetical protein
MERMAWTDERLDDRFRALDARFDRVDAELLELRREMRAGFDAVGQEFRGVREEIDRLRTTMYRFGGGLLVAQFGMIAALIARG